MQRPSYSAKAEYPVRRSFSFPSLMSRNTGSPAFAGDDGRECGALVFYEITIDSIFKQPDRQLTPSLPGIAVRRTASLPLTYAPGIHLLRKMVLRRLMDDGLSPAKPSYAPDLDEWSSDPAGRSFPGTSRSIYGAHEVPTNRRLSSLPGQSRRWATDMIRPVRLVHAANTNF
jgi:hypothetical protein